MKRSSVAVALVALGQLSCSGSQPAAPTTTQSNQLSISGVVTLGEAHPSVQLTLTSGMQDVTNSATWQSSSTAVATVSSGLVRATGLGITTISAAYQQQTVSATMSVAPDQDCIPYDPTNVGTYADPNDPTIMWVSASVPGLPAGGVGIFAAAANPADLKNLVALYQRYSQQCYVGRNYGQQYTVSYFKTPSGQQTTIAPEDCVAYNAGALQVVSEGASGWAVMSGATQLALMDTQLEGSLIAGVAAQASNECYIGRGNTRPNPYGFITEYWR